MAISKDDVFRHSLEAKNSLCRKQNEPANDALNLVEGMLKSGTPAKLAVLTLIRNSLLNGFNSWGWKNESTTGFYVDDNRVRCTFTPVTSTPTGRKNSFAELEAAASVDFTPEILTPFKEFPAKGVYSDLTVDNKIKKFGFLFSTTGVTLKVIVDLIPRAGGIDLED